MTTTGEDDGKGAHCIPDGGDHSNRLLDTLDEILRVDPQFDDVRPNDGDIPLFLGNDLTAFSNKRDTDQRKRTSKDLSTNSQRIGRLQSHAHTPYFRCSEIKSILKK